MHEQFNSKHRQWRENADRQNMNFFNTQNTGSSNTLKVDNTTPVIKFNYNKPLRPELIAPEMIFRISRVLAYDANKYADRNWETGMSWGGIFGTLMRHLWAWWAGEEKDKETNFSHLDHAACCLMFLIAYEERKIGTDDRKLKSKG